MWEHQKQPSSSSSTLPPILAAVPTTFVYTYVPTLFGRLGIETIFNDWLSIARRSNPFAIPPKKMPISLVDRYLMNNFSALYEIWTSEYQEIKVNGTKRILTIHPVDLAEKWLREGVQFDFVVSFSSIEHSGLGRYGDPIDPIGDLREVQKIACLLKKGGLFFLGLPRGQDAVVFNLHRVYGRMRLPMVMAGFDWLATFRGDSPDPQTLTKDNLDIHGDRWYSHDLFVLRNR
ncbi:hypothetical protein Q1695_009073 [Nippostrongylus brasiliensis]|nr:hypothetical protein Q1695_009073 [Nippostrongylus brasiliensis]